MSILIEEIIVGNTTLKVKFLHSLKVSSITDSAFSLVYNAATPVNTPFKPIDISADYNSISRLLTLRYRNTLIPSANYTLTVSGLISATNNNLQSESVDFITGEFVTPSYEEIIATSEEAPVEIVDYSIKSGVFSGSSEVLISQFNPEFFIEDSDPTQIEPIITTDYNYGRITIKFTSFPSSGYLTNSFFKAQRKVLARGFNRWEDLIAEVTIDQVHPWVYVDFPSNDATPVYYTADHDYFESSYKYRIKVSGKVSM